MLSRDLLKLLELHRSQLSEPRCIAGIIRVEAAARDPLGDEPGAADLDGGEGAFGDPPADGPNALASQIGDGAGAQVLGLPAHLSHPTALHRSLHSAGWASWLFAAANSSGCLPCEQAHKRD